MTSPLRLGFLYDFPQHDGGRSFEDAVRFGLADTGAADEPIEFLSQHAPGLPAGSEDAVSDALRTLDHDGALLVIGPSISDNGVVAGPLADELRLPCINYTGGERTRGEYMFHYQVGSLEEEPAILSRRAAQRGLHRVAVCFDDSIVGRRYREWFGFAARVEHLEVVAEVAVEPLSEDLAESIASLRELGPDVLVYLGLGVASRAVALARQALAWNVPVLANSALMFGYARPDWRDGWAGWEYVDTVADDNRVRRALREKSARTAAGPIGCAAYDLGRLVGEAIVRAPERARDLPNARDGLLEGLQRTKQLPATSGYDGTIMGFGQWDRAALKGRYLVLREWRDGRSIEISD